MAEDIIAAHATCDGQGCARGRFLGRTHQSMTRFGIHRVVTHYAKLASKKIPSLT
jgi:hypothetical protein